MLKLVLLFVSMFFSRLTARHLFAHTCKRKIVIVLNANGAVKIKNYNAYVELVACLKNSVPV